MAEEDFQARQRVLQKAKDEGVLSIFPLPPFTDPVYDQPLKPHFLDRIGYKPTPEETNNGRL